MDIFKAAAQGDIDTIREIAATSKDAVHSKNDYWDTPLHLAAKRGHVVAVRILVELGADLEAVNIKDLTPYLAASLAGRSETIGTLAAAGADIRATSKKDGWSALHHASANCHIEAIKTLVELGSDLETKELLSGSTPLFIAAITKEKNTADAIKTLLELGANTNAVNNHGKRPSDYVQTPELKALLQ